MQVSSPLFGILFLVLLLVVFLHRRQSSSRVRFSSGEFFQGLGTSVRIQLKKNLFALRLIVLGLLIAGLMRPRAPVEGSKIHTEGVSIVLALDCSGSMLAEDFTLRGERKNRLDVIKEVVKDFVKGRSNDSLGLVAFAARAYTVCPLTLDYSWLAKNLDRVHIGMIEDGTAIGSGIAASLNRLKNSKAKSKVIILLTDGRNNSGDISPFTAAEAAKVMGVKIYAIGAGGIGPVLFPARIFSGNKVYQRVNIDLDEDSLKKIADTTGGKYFRATDTDSLRRIYQEIDRMEKSPQESSGYLQYREFFLFWVWLAFCLLVAEIVLAQTVAMQLP